MEDEEEKEKTVIVAEVDDDDSSQDTHEDDPFPEEDEQARMEDRKLAQELRRELELQNQPRTSKARYSSRADSRGSGFSSRGGGCSGGAGGAGVGDYSSCCPKPTKEPETPKYKLEIEENDIPENWWDKLPDFEPRVYDAIALEQAAACVEYIFKGLPDMREIEHKMEARKNPKTCPRLKVQVPRTKIIKPREITYDTPVNAYVNSEQAY